MAGRVLLHVCCGPCAIWPLEVLRAEGWDVTGHFANPNLDPPEENTRRLTAARRLAHQEGLELLVEPYRPEAFVAATARWGTSAPGRCRGCYGLRADLAAARAARMGLGFFTTSLLVSPYQRHELVVEAWEEAAARHGVGFLYRDFRDGWSKARGCSRQRGLYRQTYCGCRFSRADREEGRTTRK